MNKLIERIESELMAEAEKTGHMGTESVNIFLTLTAEEEEEFYKIDKYNTDNYCCEIDENEHGEKELYVSYTEEPFCSLFPDLESAGEVANDKLDGKVFLVDGDGTEHDPNWRLYLSKELESNDKIRYCVNDDGSVGYTMDLGKTIEWAFKPGRKIEEEDEED